MLTKFKYLTTQQVSQSASVVAVCLLCSCCSDPSLSTAEGEGSVTLGLVERTDYERSAANFVRLVRIFNINLK